VAEEEARELERWVRRDGDGVRFVARSRPTISLELVAALRRGEVVAVQGDRALGTRGDMLVPFFGAPAPFPLGPFLLAGAVGVPVVPAFCLLGPEHRYLVRVAEPLEVARGGAEDAARRWVAILEEIVAKESGALSMTSTENDVMNELAATIQQWAARVVSPAAAPRG